MVIHFQSSVKELYVTLWMSLASLRSILYWVFLSEWLLFYVLTLPHIFGNMESYATDTSSMKRPWTSIFLHWALLSHDILHVQYKYWKIIATEKKIFLGSEHVSLCHVFIDKFTATDYMQMLVLPQITVLYQLKHLSYLFFFYNITCNGKQRKVTSMILWAQRWRTIDQVWAVG